MTTNKNLDLIFRVIDQEWLMFTHVENIGGQAQCQNNKAMFYIMRYSQHQALSKDFLESYLHDLEQAKVKGRNLIAEKYAYMMEVTEPSYFKAHLEAVLPKHTVLEKAAIAQSLTLLANWQGEVREKYPAVSQQGRPEEDQAGDPSALTYMEGELKTFSLQSLTFFLEALLAAYQEGHNIIEDIFITSQSFYGKEESIFSLRP